MKLLFANFLLAFGLIGGMVGGSAIPTQDKIAFRNATVENKFPEGIVFRVEVCGRQTMSTVIFNYQIAQDWGWNKETLTLDEGQTTDGCDKRKYFLQTQHFSIPPFARVKYFWSVVEGSQLIDQSPKYSFQYKDGRYAWKTIEDENLIVLWHDRPVSFGEDVKYISAHAYNRQAQFYSSVLAEPVTIIISNSSDEFFSWQEEVDYAAGLSFPEIFLTIQLVEGTEGYYDWLSDVLPHEISHIYFSHLVKRYSGASDWLDEGLATYNEYTDHLDEWNTVKAAYQADEILSLKDLEYDFGENDEKIDLAYAQSYYAILYMDEFYGEAAIANLLFEYSKGTSATAAFQKSFGKDPDQFESDFVIWLEQRLKTPPPNTALLKPAQQPVQIPTQANISKEDNASRDLTTSLYLGVLFLTMFGLLFTLFFLKPGRRSLKKRKTKV